MAHPSPLPTLLRPAIAPPGLLVRAKLQRERRLRWSQKEKDMPEYRNLGRSGLQVSKLCLGAMNFGNDSFGCDEETSLDIVQTYLDAGHNFIDTANVYSGTRSET